MKVNVKLFAAARQFAGADEISLEVDAGATVADLRKALVTAIPELEPLAAQMRYAVNSEYANGDRALADSDEVACIPPVSGG